MNRTISTVVGGALLLTSIATGAQAGGLERSGYSWDLLFTKGTVATDAGVTHVMPERRIKNARDTDPRNGPGFGSTSVDETPSYNIPRWSGKIGITPEFDCLASYQEPWGVHTDPGYDWQGNASNIETEITSHDYGLTCSYKWQVGPGFLRGIAGVSYQEIEGFKTRMVNSNIPLSGLFPGYDGTGTLDIKGDGWGWRAGVAYEIPEYEMRFSLIYNAEVDLGEVNGTVDLTEIPRALASATNPFLGAVTDVYGTATLPQQLEFKWQTGIAPDWLAFGTVKWTDWSVLGVVPFCPTVTKSFGSCGPSSPFRLTSLDLMFQDGWYVMAGIGHQFTPKWSGAAQVSWDRGTSTGLTTQTDTWLLSTGVQYQPNKSWQLQAGAAVGMLSSGSYGPTACEGNQPCGVDAAYDFGDDFVSALSVSAKLKF